MEASWTAILAIGSIGTLAIALWRTWVWRKDRAGEDLEKIYRPLHSEIKTIVEQTKTFTIPRTPAYIRTGKREFPDENWLRISQSKLVTRIPLDMRRRLSDFYERMLQDYVDLLSIVENSVKYSVSQAAMGTLDRTIKEAVKAGKDWHWMHSYSSWRLDEALADVLTPEIIRGKNPTDLDIDLLDNDLSKGIKNNLHPEDSLKNFLQSTEGRLREDPGLRLFRQQHNEIVENGLGLIARLEQRIRKIES